jgi:cytochrome b561
VRTLDASGMSRRHPADAPARYGRLRAALHWTLAIAITAMLAMGFLAIAPMSEADPAKVAIVRTHMIVGLAICAILLVIIPMAYLRRQPRPLSSGSAALDRLAKLVHHVLRLTTVAIVLSGIATAAISGIPEVVFGGASNRLPPGVTELPSFRVHALLASLLVLLVGLHVAGALFHAFVRRDRIFSRMSIFAAPSGAK